MDTSKEQLLPLHLIALDFVGFALLALGLGKQFGGLDVLPFQLPFKNYGPVFILIGIALMVPAAYHIVKKVRQRARPQDDIVSR